MSILGRIPQHADFHFHFHFEPLKIEVTPIKVEVVSGMDLEDEQEVKDAVDDLNKAAK